MRSGYRRGATVRSSRARVSACVSCAALLELGPDRVDLALEVARGRRRCRPPTSPPRGAPRRRPAAPSAVRRRARHAPRLEPVEAQLRGASTTITAPYSKPRCRLDQQRHVVHDDRRRRARPRSGAKNSSPIAGWVIASSSFRVSSVDERPLGEGGAGRANRRAAGSRRRTARRAAPAPASRLHHHPRDRVGVDHDRAPPDEDAGDGRLARPDAAREPHHEHDRRVYGTASPGPMAPATPQDTLRAADKRACCPT